MFPAMDDLAVNRPVRGAVFGYEITSYGMLSQGHRVLVDDPQWQRCAQCPERSPCFELSMGKAFMQRALAGR
jgi:hypothetical protein